MSTDDGLVVLRTSHFGAYLDEMQETTCFAHG
jgi:hypothetical protein